MAVQQSRFRVLGLETDYEPPSGRHVVSIPPRRVVEVEGNVWVVGCDGVLDRIPQEWTRPRPNGPELAAMEMHGVGRVGLAHDRVPALLTVSVELERKEQVDVKDSLRIVQDDVDHRSEREVGTDR